MVGSTATTQGRRRHDAGTLVLVLLAALVAGAFAAAVVHSHGARIDLSRLVAKNPPAQQQPARPHHAAAK